MIKVFFLLILFAVAAVVITIIYAALKFWIFFKKRIMPVSQQYQQNMENYRRGASDSENEEILYSENDVVVMKGDAKTNPASPAQNQTNNSRALNE